MRFVPYHLLGGAPNVIVDGSPTASTVLVLSHWPGSPTPVELQDDLSAQIAFHALDRPDLLVGLEAVSNNHFDQDGLASVYALIEPDDARRRRAALIDLARAGDFATYESRDSMRLAFALAAYDDPARSPLGADVFEGGYEQQCGRLYEELLERLPAMLDDVDALRPLWEHEDAHLGESLAAIATGTVGLAEHPDLDLVVVTVPDDWAGQMTTRFTVARTDSVHPAAVHRSSDRLRVLTMQGRRYRLELRYESWVMFRSRPVMPRPDLRALAVMLDQMGDTARWHADAPGSLTPALRSEHDSDLSPEAFLATVTSFLRTAEPAWDPFDVG